MDRLGLPEAFDASRYDCLLLVHGRNFTNAGRENLLAFLNAGRDVILAGGRGFPAERFSGGNITLAAFGNYTAYRPENAPRFLLDRHRVCRASPECTRSMFLLGCPTRRSPTLFPSRKCSALPSRQRAGADAKAFRCLLLRQSQAGSAPDQPLA